jgi:hypothetical protein
MQTHLFCPNCKSVVHVYFPKEKPTIQKKQILEECSAIKTLLVECSEKLCEILDELDSNELNIEN